MDNMEMGTPINNLNNKTLSKKNSQQRDDISNLVKELENNLDNFDNTMAYNDTPPPRTSSMSNHSNNIKDSTLREIQETKALRYNPNHFSDSEEEEEEIDQLQNTQEPIKIENNINKWNDIIYKLLMFLKYPFLLLILFILVSSPDFTKMYENLSIIRIINSYYHNSSLFIKSIGFVCIFFILKHLDEKYN